MDELPSADLGEETRLCASEDVLMRALEGEAVLLDLASGTYFGLNDVGVRVWELIETGATIGAMRKVLVEEFEVEETTLATDLTALLGDLEKRGLVRRAS